MKYITHFSTPIFASAVFALVIFFLPSGASAACPAAMQITYPSDGQTFAATLPLSINPIYDTAADNTNHYLDVYRGVPGNAQIVAGHSQGKLDCGTNHAAVNTDVLSASGDYFYVLYTINQSM